MDQEIQFCMTFGGVRLAYAKVGQGSPLIKVANWLNHLEYDWRPLTTIKESGTGHNFSETMGGFLKHIILQRSYLAHQI